MSRGGGRGGRGGRRGGGPQLPWQEDPTLRVDGRPAEAFPVSTCAALPVARKPVARAQANARAWLIDY